MVTNDGSSARGQLRGISARRGGLIAVVATAVLVPLTGDLYTALGVVAATAIILLASRRHRSASARAATRWRFVPLATALLMLPLIVLTWGAGILLAPVTVGLTIATLRRLPTWRDPIVILGALMNGCLALGFAMTLAIVAHEAPK